MADHRHFQSSAGTASEVRRGGLGNIAIGSDLGLLKTDTAPRATCYYLGQRLPGVRGALRAWPSMVTNPPNLIRVVPAKGRQRAGESLPSRRRYRRRRF